ncbi:MAG: hypothetical protein A2W90_18100 [Bacteroidetes bacterium GWF2_42_66]|nr:MAG: hypothetical protein A2W92_06090 [Bacteroidetes bacterium GWA2_42_15]OFX98165.1 MAG: hypothetical protein A2W89_09590 [Bacteroidetes bacterium GWE2_42_39]OFY42550.1 MAG: hypothetical protein A2W90_18100 [Bacteroidetes bacterium GWF2_42_66]HBL74266.1 hypothetical protein [Prolixibacteraceae bacterium]HCU64035.1 hypothetical protein [Prolixibacteraceae bacterium]
MGTIPVILVLIIVFSVVMIVIKSKKKNVIGETEEKPLDPFDVIQINSRGVQLLESLHIIESTKDIETLRSRIDFLLKTYSSLVVLAVFKHKYVTEAEKAMNTIKARYPDRIITQLQAALLLTPNLDQLKNHISSCVVLSYAAFVKSELSHIDKLVRHSAIESRKELIIRIGYDMKYLFKMFDLPDSKHLEAIEEIRRQFYTRK